MHWQHASTPGCTAPVDGHSSMPIHTHTPEQDPAWSASAVVCAGSHTNTDSRNELHMLFSCVAGRTASSGKRRTAKLRVLLDSGSTHSFLSEQYSQFGTPTGQSAKVQMGNGIQQEAEVASLCVTFGDVKFQQQVGIMPMNSAFDVVLGQDWLEANGAQLCYDRNDPDFTGRDDRHVSFKRNGKKHIVPLPPHLKESTLNSVVWNTAAAMKMQAEETDVSAEFADVSHAFIVHVQDASAAGLAALLQEQCAIPEHDNSLPHHIESTESELKCHTADMQEGVADLVSEFKDRFPADMPAGLPPDRDGMFHAIPLKPGEHRPPYRRPYRLTPAEKAEVEA